MERTWIIKAWAALAGLSALTTGLTLLAAAGGYPVAIGAAVLVLAGCKARIILFYYLGLARSRFWARGFDAAIWLFLAVALGFQVAVARG